ncbi:MAG: 1-acyl-sn-glycerol-3-phosphate acyltransferase, partial [Halobacteriovoraceae bacterium]|nr:1-acyl-sn-glycerol-3-phosphate acyltransferase [Halobacteriovoraceae bacterium]
MPNKLQETILGYSKLKERIEGKSDSTEERKKVFKNVKEIEARVSPTYLKYIKKFFDRVIYHLYDDIIFDDSTVNLKELLKKHLVVLVPNHQSHADYVAINYMFYKRYKVPVYAAGGKNLNLPLLGFLFRRVGCFFIRRSFASDITYKLTLEAYLYHLLKTGKVIEFFFEGGRSRTGKLLAPRFGLYRMLIDAHLELSRETDKRLVFIPVSIAHEYIPETKTLARELESGAKKKESFRHLFSLLGLFSRQLGSIHIKLGEEVEVAPFSADTSPDTVKREIEYLAFKCFRKVGENMLV